MPSIYNKLFGTKRDPPSGSANNNTTTTSLVKKSQSKSRSQSKPQSQSLDPISSSTNKYIDQYHLPQCNNPQRKQQPIKVTINIETPPILMYGPTLESSGSFFSGNVVIDILQDVQLECVQVAIIQSTKYSGPFISQPLQSCNDCQRNIVEISNWDLLNKNNIKLFKKGQSYAYPFSDILSGQLPPSTSLSTGSFIKYELVCFVKYNNDEIINLAMPIIIKRSILRSHDRNSLRVFPPTDVTASAVIPNVVYSRSVFPVEIRMDNLVSKERRWRMRKLNWRLEESVIVKINHCNNHLDKFNLSQKEMKKLQRNRKVHKSSGGLGHNTLNFYFEIPEKVVKARALAEQARISTENERIRLQRGIDPIVEEPELDIVQTNEMGPLSSNWTVPLGHGPPTPLSSITSPANTATPSPNLANPDEIIVSSSPELYVEEIKTLATGELKSGWKSDFSGSGRIEMNVEVPITDLVSTGFNNATSNLSSITSNNCNSALFDPKIYEANSNECNCSVDIDDPKLGIYVSHNLILEAVVGEELLSGVVNNYHNRNSNDSTSKQPVRPTSHPLIETSNSGSNSASLGGGGGTRLGLSASDFPDVQVGPHHVTGNKGNPMNNIQGVPTGVARVLRMQFRVCLTERSGMGISWDLEVPPTYEAIVDEPQPPSYI